MKSIAIVFTLSVALNACAADEIIIGGHSDLTYVEVVDIPPEMNRQLDLLFVVDNTSTMSDRQLELTHSFRRLISYLEFMNGGLPDLHIGIVSTDLGVGLNAVAGCTVTGDIGGLQSAPRTPGCRSPDQAFIRDYAAGDVRDVNYEGGSLTDTFACISQLGTRGCEFEQPLEAMRLALDRQNADNAGFIRDDAALGVVILTDEDDCSVFDTGMFDPRLDGSGTVSKFRCFQNGVTCGGDDVRREGEYTNCHPKADSDFMHDVDLYADFLEGVKFDPEDVVVSGVIGDANFVQVSVDLDERPQVVPACRDGDGDGVYPAVRLQEFLDRTHYGGQVDSLCGAQPLGALATTGKQLRKVMGTSCLDGALADVDDTTRGLQFDCKIFDRAPDGTQTDLPRCADPYHMESSGMVPCYAIKTGPEQCGDFQPTQLALQVWRGSWDTPQPAGTHTIGECLVQQPDQK